jgi:hypothetical protein
MIRRTCLLAACAAVAAIWFGVPALADNINPPFWSGFPGTTFEQYEFSTSNPNPSPDLVNNPFGTPQATVIPGFMQTWQETFAGRQGVWPLSGTIEVWIPNQPQPNPEKDIWVQLDWQPQAQGNRPTVWELDSQIQSTLLQENLLPNNWIHSTYQITLPYNPTHETVRVDGGIMVDELVIHTICVPEPSSVVLLAAGAFSLLAYVWRRRRS